MIPRQPEVRVSPDGGRIAVRWPNAPIDTRELNGDTNPRWRVVGARDPMGTLEPDETAEGWQPLAPLADPVDDEVQR
jgi:hypothetical protein